MNRSEKFIAFLYYEILDGVITPNDILYGAVWGHFGTKSEKIIFKRNSEEHRRKNQNILRRLKIFEQGEKIRICLFCDRGKKIFCREHCKFCANNNCLRHSKVLR
jgi:hypothetical protein